jgi:tetratricopeptide (TPR) repeat protein
MEGTMDEDLTSAKRTYLIQALLAATFLIMAMIQGPGVARALDESLADTAEKEGRLGDAFISYMKIFEASLGRTDEEYRLRKKIIGVAQRIQPPPALPDEAQRYANRGLAKAKLAESKVDFALAAAEFENALRLAPWHGDYYYNFGVMLEAAGKPRDAIRSFQFYILASPGAADIPKVQAKVAQLEVSLESEARARELKGFMSRRWHFINAVKVNGCVATSTTYGLTVNISETGEADITLDMAGTAYRFEGKLEGRKVKAQYKSPKYDVGDAGRLTLAKAGSLLRATLNFTYRNMTYSYDDYMRK